MSDYKDLVSDLLGKAKELTNSEAVNDAVEKVKDTASASGIAEVFEKGTQRAKSFGTATKATLDLNREYKELERVFCEIGKLYYEQNVSEPEGFFVPLFEQVRRLQDAIAGKSAELDAYKASFDPAAAEKHAEQPHVSSGLGLNIDEFEEIVNQTETDGTTF